MRNSPSTDGSGCISPLFIDFEASSLTGWPIEIGWAEIVDGQVVAESHLIRPESDWDEAEWDEIAAEIHGITLDQLRSEGLPARDVAERTATIFRGRMLVSDAADADAAWLAQLMAASPEHYEWRVVDMLTFMKAFSPRARLRYMGLTSDIGRHRAGTDAKRLAAAWLTTLVQP